ncbi:MAG TPA: DNA polymerase III subunit delta [Candidatus Limnocylindria bacterium]
MVFLLHGEDPFRTRLRVGELVESLLAGGVGEPGDLSQRRSPQLGGALGLTRIDARSDPLDAITLAGQSQGLFAAVDERQVVLVEHAETLTSAEFLASFPSESALVLVAVEALRAGRGRARGRAKAGAPVELALPDAVQEIGGRAQRIERLLPFEVKGWIGARARLHKITLQPDAIDALAYALGPDTERIENEVQKLGAYANGAPVTAVDVRALVSGAIESDIFELTKAVVRRNHREAVPLLERLLAEGNAPQQILALLLWQFRVLLFASTAPSGADAERQAKAIRSSPGAILRYVQHARGLSRSDIARAYESLYATDISIKTGRAESDEAALLLCVLDLCGVAGADLRDLLLTEAPRRG